jgi:hypothetical protein
MKSPNENSAQYDRPNHHLKAMKANGSAIIEYVFNEIPADWNVRQLGQARGGRRLWKRVLLLVLSFAPRIPH